MVLRGGLRFVCVSRLIVLGEGSVVHTYLYDSMSDLGEIEVYQRADFQSGSRVLKKVF